MNNYQNEPIRFGAIETMGYFHDFGEGIHLVKRRAETSKAVEHYGFAVIGTPLEYFTPWSRNPIVFHKTNLGVQPDSFYPMEWEKVETLKGSCFDAVFRANLSYRDAYDVFFDNCEHFARFVVTGKKESTQVQGAAAVGLFFIGVWGLWRTDN